MHPCQTNGGILQHAAAPPVSAARAPVRGLSTRSRVLPVTVTIGSKGKESHKLGQGGRQRKTDTDC